MARHRDSILHRSQTFALPNVNRWLVRRETDRVVGEHQYDSYLSTAPFSSNRSAYIFFKRRSSAFSSGNLRMSCGVQAVNGLSLDASRMVDCGVRDRLLTHARDDPFQDR